MTSTQIEKQIAHMERQLAAKRQELDYVRTIEDLERQKTELERRKLQAELDLKRFQANSELAEVAAQEPTSEAEPNPEPMVAPVDTEPEPEAERDDTETHPEKMLPRDTVRLVQNVFDRLKNLDPLAKTFDKEADAAINRVRSEGSVAVRYLVKLVGILYNQGQYRRQIKNALRQPKGGAK